MLVNGYHTAGQLVASEWIGRLGWDLEEMPRWPSVNNHFQPPELPINLPYAWDEQAGHAPLARTLIIGSSMPTMVHGMEMNSMILPSNDTLLQ